eukprot:c21437_g1_i1.p2 GENE.c21437_g1_i1~~c21437_g1_i1.p2  ORF type:complete len:232 (+),score=41.64 c21437_g1_i1:50-745(+)
MAVKVLPLMTAALNAAACIAIVLGLFMPAWYTYHPNAAYLPSTMHIGLLNMCIEAQSSVAGSATVSTIATCTNLRSFADSMSDLGYNANVLSQMGLSGLVAFSGMWLALLLTGATTVSASIASLDDFGGSSTTVFRARKIAAVLAAASATVTLGLVVEWMTWGILTNISGPEFSGFGWAFWIVGGMGLFDALAAAALAVQISGSDARVYSEFMPLLALNGHSGDPRQQYLS